MAQAMEIIHCICTYSMLNMFTSPNSILDYWNLKLNKDDLNQFEFSSWKGMVLYVKKLILVSLEIPMRHFKFFEFLQIYSQSKLTILCQCTWTPIMWFSHMKHAFDIQDWGVSTLRPFLTPVSWFKILISQKKCNKIWNCSTVNTWDISKGTNRICLLKTEVENLGTVCQYRIFLSLYLPACFFWGRLRGLYVIF